MGKSTIAVAASRSYPSPDSEQDGRVSAASTGAETSPAAERNSDSCQPVSARTQRRANRRQKSHSPEVWEDVKPDIEQLYLKDNLRLKVSFVLHVTALHGDSSRSCGLWHIPEAPPFLITYDTPLTTASLSRM